MGNGEDPNEHVVDEKMWNNDEDDLQEMQQENEMFEENSKLAGDQIEDEMRTGHEKDEEQNSDDAPGQDSKQKDSNQDERMEPETDETDEMINDDTEDKYEDKNVGVDVRNDDGGEEEKDSKDGVDMNDLNLDDGDEGSTFSAEDKAGNVEPDACENPVEEEIDPDAENDEDEREDDMNVQDVAENVGEGGVVAEDSEDPNESEGNNGDETHITPPPKNKYESNDALGIAAKNGQDIVADTNDEKQDPENSEDTMGGEAMESRGADETSPNESTGAGGNGIDNNWKSRRNEVQSMGNQSDIDDVPNPFRSPGDAEKFWHKKLNIIQDRQKGEQPSEETSQDQQDEVKEKDGQFEYTQEEEDNQGQVLGIAEEDQAKQLEDHSDDDFESCDPEIEKKSTDIDGNRENRDQSHLSSNRKNETAEHTKSVDKSDAVNEDEQEADGKFEVENPAVNSYEEDIIPRTNRAMTDSTQIHDKSHDDDNDNDSDGDICEMDTSEQLTMTDIQRAREYWQTIQSDTNHLSRRLCEKLRLVMEPLVATKLRGDYRTGKRVNMKRIIGYIASGYRKDKIWLRRTKPAKRDYRVLIAVDDSESMQKSRAGDMALRALATLANGMSQLEIGQLGIASFGEDMKLLHPFHIPFSAESGINVVSNFKFDAKRTRTALCVESAIIALEGAHSESSSMQLVFMISDGRIERDSRSKLRRLIRQMSEKNMLMVMIIVEGEGNDSQNKSDESILNMKEVSFVNGKPKIKHFIEDYPFPYYLVVGDLAALPEILGDCLRQWFEMLTQIQNAG
jgi:midasin